MAPKSKTASAAAKSSAPSTNGTTTPVSSVVAEKKDTSTTTTSGRPDKKLYDDEQAKIKAEIDALQLKLSAVRDKISLATKGGNGNERRNALRAELDGLRDQQSGYKASRSKVLDQVKALQESIAKRVKDLQAAKSKTPYRTLAEVDAHIKNLEKQVESGNLKLADEKRALQEISSCKRSRRTVETFQADQESIEADRKAIDELKQQLDDPEFKATSDRYDAIRAELDDLKKEGDEAYAGRSKLFAERDDLQAKINTLFNEKRESAARYKDANDRYWNKLNEERARRAERAKAERAAQEAEKRKQIAEQLREDAEAPAFQAQIEDCQTLIDSFLGKTSGNVTFKSTPNVSKDVAGVPKLELRKVEESSADGLVARKKKGDNEEDYFIGKGKKGKKTTPKANGSAESSNSQLNIPLPTLSALLTLSIPPPASSADVPRVVEDLKTKKAWFEANQERVTKENVAKAEAQIQKLAAKEAAQEIPASGVVTPIGTSGEEVPVALGTVESSEVPPVGP